MGGRMGTGDFDKQREIEERFDQLKKDDRDLENYTHWGTPRAHVALKIDDSKYLIRHEMDHERRSRIKW